jgi:hypothetical protein
MNLMQELCHRQFHIAHYTYSMQFLELKGSKNTELLARMSLALFRDTMTTVA